MKISVITTCYNREKTIAQAIESVLGQDYDDLEYVIVDGASKDGSLQQIKEAAKQQGNKTVKIISEPDHGMYEAINKGIRTATGDVVGLVHSDDMLFSNDIISKIADIFSSTDADIIYGNGLYVNENDTSKVVRNWISGKYSRGKVRRGWLPLHPTVYVRRECMMQHGLYDETFKIAADSDFLVRYLYDIQGLKVVYLDEYMIRMRMGGLSTDKNKMKQKWKEDLTLYKAHGFHPRMTLAMKIMRKIPQFIHAKFIKA